MKISWLQPGQPEAAFPPVEHALHYPDGLLAAGGDLHPVRLLNAYRSGIFPWYEAGQPILWWSPQTRAVIFADKVHVSRSLARLMRRQVFRVSLDRAFARVIGECAAPRGDERGTWITAEMQAAYIRLHELGHAHSVEVWDRETLAGGLYGVALGKVFFAESMFSRQSNASKLALVSLCRLLEARGFGMVDCQIPSEHLSSMGAQTLPRTQFMSLLNHLVAQAPLQDWVGMDDITPAKIAPPGE